MVPGQSSARVSFVAKFVLAQANMAEMLLMYRSCKGSGSVLVQLLYAVQDLLAARPGCQTGWRSPSGAADLAWPG